MRAKLVKTLFSLIFFLGASLIWVEYARAVENKSRVISPYWQSDSTSYSFIAISHPSLTHAASQIGVIVNAIQNDQAAFSTAVTFTISAGTTERVFIVRSNQSVVNASSIPTANFIVGTTDFEHGHVLIEPSATNPEVQTSTSGNGDGNQDITMLSFWGAVVVEANTTGFAMEFIGDVHDSAAIANMDDSAVVSGVN